LLQRLAQLVEQPRVLDRDDGLGGEIADQLDLLVGEWNGPRLRASANAGGTLWLATTRRAPRSWR
jgi:hypothetical protein